MAPLGVLNWFGVQIRAWGESLKNYTLKFVDVDSGKDVTFEGTVVFAQNAPDVPTFQFSMLIEGSPKTSVTLTHDDALWLDNVYNYLVVSHPLPKTTELNAKPSRSKRKVETKRVARKK